MSLLGGHLWYLGAILYVLIIVFLADKFNFSIILYYLIPILLVCDLLFGKYSLLIWGREFPVCYVRNFLFVGLPYFCIGRLIQSGMGNRIKTTSLMGMIALFSTTSIMERYILVSADMNAIRDHYISSTFLVLAIFLFAQRIDVKDSVLSKIGCKYSSWLYILHPIFISGFAVATKAVGLYDYYLYVAPFVVYAATVVFLIIISSIKNKLKEILSYGKQI